MLDNVTVVWAQALPAPRLLAICFELVQKISVNGMSSKRSVRSVGEHEGILDFRTTMLVKS